VKPRQVHTNWDGSGKSDNSTKPGQMGCVHLYPDMQHRSDFAQGGAIVYLKYWLYLKKSDMSGFVSFARIVSQVGTNRAWLT